MSDPIDDFDKYVSRPTDFRTDRNNNPIAAAVGASGRNQFTDALDSAGIPWEAGDPFPNDASLRTIRIKGDPVEGARAILGGSNALKWYRNTTGKTVLPKYGVRSADDFNKLPAADQNAIIHGIYQSEGGSGKLTKSAISKSTPDDFGNYVQQANDDFNKYVSSGQQSTNQPLPDLSSGMRGTLATYDRGKPAAPPVEPAQQSTYRLAQPQPRSAVQGAVTGALEAANVPAQQFSDNPQLDKALHDVEWHFGRAVMNTLHLLDPAARAQVLKEASRLAQADEAKRARGEPIVRSAAWQQANQQRLGLDKNTRVRDEAVSLQRRTQLLTNQTPEAQAAAQHERAAEFAALPWYERGAITGVTGITEAVGGTARLASKVGVPGAASLAQGTQAMSQDVRSRQAGAAEISQPSLLEKAEEGLLTYAPLLATGHPEGLAARIATGAGTFGGYTAAQTYGTGASAGESLKAGAKAAPLGALLSVPASVVPLASPFGRAATATASKVAGTYGLGRLEGATNQEALDQAAMIAGFEAPGLVGEGFGAARRGIAGPSIESRATGQFEPEVQTAAKAAFDRAGISPEAQEKATRSYGPQYNDPRAAAQQAVEQAESQRAVSTHPAVQPPADVADYWKVAVPQPDGTTRTEGFHTRQDAEHRAAELAGELPTAEYPAVPAAPAAESLEATPNERAQIQQQLADELGPPTHDEGVPITTQPPAEPASPIITNAGRTYELRDGDWWMTSGDKAIRVTNASTRAELNRQAGRFEGQGGFAKFGKPPVAGYGKSGAVVDRQISPQEAVELSVKEHARQMASNEQLDVDAYKAIGDRVDKAALQRDIDEALATGKVRGETARFGAFASNGRYLGVFESKAEAESHIDPDGWVEPFTTDAGFVDTQERVRRVSPDYDQLQELNRDLNARLKAERERTVGADLPPKAQDAFSRMTAVQNELENRRTRTFEPFSNEGIQELGDIDSHGLDMWDFDPKWRGQEGFVGERRPVKPAPAGVRTGAVEDLPAERRPVDVQPRQSAGQFAESTDFSAIKAELLRAGDRINADYHTLLSHNARREGLRAASGMAIRDYFTRLHRFVATHAPDKLPLVEQAEAAEAKGDPVTATLLSERALASPHDFVNRLGSAVMAVDAQAKGMELPARMATNWRGVLAEARERNQREGAWKRQRGSIQGEPVNPAPAGVRTGAVADIGRETFRQAPFGVSRAATAETASEIKEDSGYDLRRKPARGVADPTEVAKAAVPIYNQLRAEAGRKIADGSLDPSRYTTFVRTALNSRLLTEGWHKTNERAAYKIVTDLAKQETYDPATRSFRTIPSQTSRFIDAAPLNFRIDSTDRTTARDLRREYSGAKNAQVVLGNNLAKQLKAEVKDDLGRQAIYFNLAAGGDKTVLRSYLANPSELLDPYRPAIERALDLKPWEQKWANTLRQGYDELGDYSRSLGTIRNVKENYHNRLYVQEKAGKDFVKSEAFRRGLNAYTSHGKQQVYANVLDAVLGKLPDGSEGTPKKLAVTDAADAYSILNEEMARANTNAKFREAMAASGLGKEVPAGRIPQGFTALPNMGREIPISTGERLRYSRSSGWGWSQPAEEGATVLRNEFVVPDGIAKGLRAVTNIDSNHPFINKINEVQGRIKTLDLALSAFHHLAMLHTLIAQTKGGIDILARLPQMREWAKSGELDAAEQDFVRHTGMTTRVESNADIMRKLTEGDDVLSRATRLPIVKQTFQLAEKSSDFLFDNIQRKMKVLDYANKAAAWVGDHPDATDRQITEAKRSLASEINAAYGGLNWTALGVSKADLGLLRLVLLAPDWTTSNVLLPAKIATGGPGGKAALQHLVTSTIASTIATVGLNHLLHGDTDKARKLLAQGKYTEAGVAFYGQPEIGHEMEVEIAPGVYLPMFRGGISDIVKAISLYRELGPARGTLQFVSNKLAPFPRTVVGAISNTVMGKPILVPYNPSKSWMANTLAQLKQTGEMLRPALPVPLGVSQAYRIATGGKPTAAGIAVALSGAGRVTSDRGPRTEAEKYMYRLSQLEGKPIYEEGTDAETKYQLKSSLISQLRSGKNVDKAVDKAANAGDLSADDIKDIYQGGDANLFAERFKKLKLDNAIDVYKLADADERKLIDDGGLLWKKVESTLPKLSPNEQKKVFQRLDELEKAEKKPAKSVGVSRAQELGVPMPIPPRNANETDVAYRARLLQLGRARSAKLDAAANSTDFNTLNRFQQRSNLYHSLAQV